MKAEDYAKVRETAMNALALGRTKDGIIQFLFTTVRLDIIEEKPEELKKHLEEMKVLVLQDENVEDCCVDIGLYFKRTECQGHMEEAF